MSQKISTFWLMVFGLMLTSVINNAIQVRQREQSLEEQICELKIVIDEIRKQKVVEQILESDYFQSLQKRASEIRARTAGRKGKEK
jgi:hypothetical protein